MADNDTNFSSPSDNTDLRSDFRPAVPLTGNDTNADSANVRQQLTEGASKLQGQAGEKAREFAELGKERAAGALDQLATMLTDAAGQVDTKLGAQYGGYARNAADAVQKFSGQVKTQDFDQLLDQARDLIRKSPAVAIGGAAAVGFVLARLFQSGVDADKV